MWEHLELNYHYMAQLQYEECVRIQVYLEEWRKHRWIGKKLGRSNSTISAEVGRYSAWGVYRAKIAWEMRKTRRRLINTLRCKIERWGELEEDVRSKIEQYWSPEQIAWEGKKVWKDTIYKRLKQYPELVKKYCRRRWKKYKYGTIMAGYIYNRVSIHERPDFIEWYARLWDWEWDTVGNGCVTYVDRKSKYLLSGLTNGKYAKHVTEKTVELFKSIPEELRKSITLDNGREFVEHYMWKWMCGIESTYFADKWHPGQRWLNENTNGLLRQFFPKKTDFNKVSEEELAKAVELLNNRPRKSLGYKTPTQVLFPNCADLK